MKLTRYGFDFEENDDGEVEGIKFFENKNGQFCKSCDVEELEAENEQLKKENQELKSEISDLKCEIQDLKDQIYDLKLIIINNILTK